jgi:hypothetical protein
MNVVTILYHSQHPAAAIFYQVNWRTARGCRQQSAWVYISGVDANLLFAQAPALLKAF